VLADAGVSLSARQAHASRARPNSSRHTYKRARSLERTRFGDPGLALDWSDNRGSALSTEMLVVSVCMAVRASHHDFAFFLPPMKVEMTRRQFLRTSPREELRRNRSPFNCTRVFRSTLASSKASAYT
jgi:hypothetical protein